MVSPSVIRYLAIGLFILAVVLTFVGWLSVKQTPPVTPQLTHQPATTPLRSSQPLGTPAVVVSRAVMPGESLRRSSELRSGEFVGNIDIAYYNAPPPGSFDTLEAVEGQVVSRPLLPGDLVRSAAFASGGPLSAGLGVGERGIAIAIDDLIAAGQYMFPGDLVDVIYSATPPANLGGQPDVLAKTLFQGVRVLAVGERLEGLEPVEGLRQSGRFAVVALPADEMTALVLAENTGRLRLAVIGETERLARQQLEPLAPRLVESAAVFLQRDILFDNVTAEALPSAAKRTAQASAKTALTQEPQAYRIIQHVGADVRVSQVD